jgi:hypothetical protein
MPVFHIGSFRDIDHPTTLDEKSKVKLDVAC